MKPGDLVRYVRHPRCALPDHVLPLHKRPYGLVVEIKKITVGTDEATQGIMEVVLVKWFDTTWNSPGAGVSEEHRPDLEVIQESCT